MTNFFNFCLSKEVFISPSLLRNNFLSTEFKYVDFSCNIYNSLLHFLLADMCLKRNPVYLVQFLSSFLYRCFFSLHFLVSFKIFVLSFIFFQVNMIHATVDFLLCILLGACSLNFLDQWLGVSLILETSLSAIISSHISAVGSLVSPAHPLLLFPAFPPFFPSFSLWYSHHTQLISFVVVPQFSDTLLQSFHISVWGDCHRHALKFRDSFLIRVQSSDEPIKDILHLLQFF